MKNVILIIKTGALGDVLRTTGILKNLHKKHSYCEIWWLANNISIEILQNNQYISKILSIDDNKDVDFIKEILFNLVLSFEDDNICLDLATKLKKNKLIGGYLDHCNNPVYTNDSKLFFDMSLLNKDCDGKLVTANLLKFNNLMTFQEIMSTVLNIKGNYPYDFKYIFNISNESVEKMTSLINNIIDPTEFIIGFNPFCGTRWESKMLSVDRACELIEFIYEKFKYKIYLLGGEQEHLKNVIIHKKFKDVTYFLNGVYTVAEYSCIIKRTNMIISVDSLAMHLALLNNIPTIALFGSTCDSEIEMFNNGIKIHAGIHYNCDCFFATKCKHNCIDKIPNQKYESAVNKLLYSL